MTSPTPTYQRDGVTLYCGDCMDVLPGLASGSVDAVVTDPPYGVNLGKVRRNQVSLQSEGVYKNYDDSPESLSLLVAKVMPEIQRIGRRAAITPGVRNMWLYPRPQHTGSFFYPAASGCNSWGFSCWQPILYYGKDPYGGKGSRPDSTKSTERAERNGHPCPKPIGQWQWLVERASLEGQTILDPFMGSGTTGVACVNTGRKFIGIEKSQEYFDIAARRIEEAFAKEALFVA